MPCWFDSCSSCRFRDHPLQELDPLECNHIRTGFDVAPNCGGSTQVAQRKPKTLNRDPAVVLQLAESGKGFVPFDVAASRYAAVILTRMNMLQMPAYREISGGDVL